MSAHTPGPWHYKPHAADSNYMLIFCSSDQHEGDTLRGYCGEANARLIAAAPELLAACVDALALLRTVPDEFAMPDHPVFGALRDAIAKAEGRA